MICDPRTASMDSASEPKRCRPARMRAMVFSASGFSRSPMRWPRSDQSMMEDAGSQPGSTMRFEQDVLGHRQLYWALYLPHCSAFLKTCIASTTSSQDGQYALG